MWIAVILLIIIALYVIGFLYPHKEEKKEEDRNIEELDEELEDYDYLDDITGREDKWWI
jgi:Ca2+/Na+ antiporter